MGAYDDDYGRGGDGTKPPVDIEDPTEDEDYDKEGPGTDPSQPPSDESTPPSDSQPPGDGNTDPIVIKPTEPPSSGFLLFVQNMLRLYMEVKFTFTVAIQVSLMATFTAHSNSVDIYDIANDRWEWGIAAPVGRSAHSGAKVSDTFYFWGGSDGEEAQKTLEIFRPESMRTELLYRVATNYTELTHNVTYKASFGLEIEPAQRKISNHASAIWKDKLFILGGEDENGITNQVTVYDVSTSKIKVSTFALTTLSHS